MGTGIGLLVCWGSIFALNTSLNSKIGFDFDDTVGFSSPSFAAGVEKYGDDAIKKGHPDHDKFWTEVNGHPERDIPKPMTLAIVYAARALGCDVVVITARHAFGRKPFVDYWQPTFSEIYFAKDKARFLTRDRYLAFFGDSDSDIEEAQKAGVLGIRILRSPDSSNDYGYDPGSLGEWVIPATEGPSGS